jgi:hypothetical protein
MLCLFPAFLLLSSYSEFLTELKMKSAHISCLLSDFLSPHTPKTYINIRIETCVSVERVYGSKKRIEDATCLRKLVVV